MNSQNNIIIFDIFEAVNINTKKDDNLDVVNRSSYAISFCTEGEIVYEQHGKKFVSNKNTVVILPKGGSYRVNRTKSGCFPLINFDCLFNFCDEILTFSINDVEDYLYDFERIRELLLIEDRKCEMFSILYHIFDKIFSDRTKAHILYPAINYIEKNFRDPSITNDTLASICNISEVYFRKIFVKKYGITPKQFIIDMRIKEAKRLLSEGALKVTAIAEECGFSNTFHFCRLFKQKIGMTPTEYCKENHYTFI